MSKMPNNLPPNLGFSSQEVPTVTESTPLTRALEVLEERYPYPITLVDGQKFILDLYTRTDASGNPVTPIPANPNWLRPVVITNPDGSQTVKFDYSGDSAETPAINGRPGDIIAQLEVPQIEGACKLFEVYGNNGDSVNGTTLEIGSGSKGGSVPIEDRPNFSGKLHDITFCPEGNEAIGVALRLEGEPKDLVDGRAAASFKGYIKISNLPIPSSNPEPAPTVPEQPTTPAPKQTTTTVPEQPTTTVPEQPTTPAPKQTTTTVPEQPTTPAPKQTTTTVPEQTTTTVVEVPERPVVPELPKTGADVLLLAGLGSVVLSCGYLLNRIGRQPRASRTSEK